MAKYTLNLDENKYVLSAAHTPNDNIELDLSQVDLQHLSAYQFIDGKLVLDEAKKQIIMDAEKAREETPTQLDCIEAQCLFTAMMTDTLI